MPKYRDRFGKPISEGDVVLTAITINHDTYKGFSFATTIVRRRGRSLILDGVHTVGYLCQRPRHELVKVTPETDLRAVEAEFLHDRRHS